MKRTPSLLKYFATAVWGAARENLEWLWHRVYERIYSTQTFRPGDLVRVKGSKLYPPRIGIVTDIRKRDTWNIEKMMYEYTEVEIMDHSGFASYPSFQLEILISSEDE